MRIPVCLAAALLTSALLPGAAALLGGTTSLATDADQGSLLVGYQEGALESVLQSVSLLGGTVEDVEKDLRLLRVTGDVALLTSTLSTTSGVDFVDSDGPTSIDGAQWNGAQWNGAQWNGAQWNGAQWNGAQWNGMEAEDAQWNELHGAPASVDDPGRLMQWPLAVANVPPAWNVSTGERRADLCVLDSGVDFAHGDLAPNLWTGPNGEHGVNFVEPGQSPADDAGHGTHVAGIASGAVGNGWGVAGIGNTRVMSVKVLDAEGDGTEANLAWGLAWCARNGAEVALMALSVSEPGPALERAIGFAVAQDVLLVASAGNDGPCTRCVAYPARHPAVVAVTAVDEASLLAPFGSQGKQAEIAAPGSNVLSTFVGGGFAYGSGTSQAAAHVAGAAALLRDADPGMSAQQARQALRGTAVDLGLPGHDHGYGHGLLNAGAALEHAAGE